ncbi:antibiotic biosynthesis monooxygenase [Gracilibacillus salitolerans]|uniref:Antibiotic biosynthesis monooxygenase n=1 Tax=Gracilibacillus salitolerans TaxID=2663022 RepID=A0A5Q2TDJ8_9BACI|nr:antibiotic biosynthesis monooxygenase family protein [Gracilibacillus salitolerans]QGH32809.1 antibiotic biosynthesis monooxygenase [Gracilibacillus salitolerans]
MIMIAGKLYVAPEYRAKYLESLEEFIRHTRSKKGCLDFILAADPIEAGRVNLLEQWEKEEDLKQHQATANPPEPVTPIISEDVKKYEISKSGPVFP